MKQASDALIAYINNAQQFRMADLFEFNLLNGQVLRYTNYDTTVVDRGNAFLGSAILINRSRVRVVLGTEVDTLDVTINPHPADVVNSTTFLKACTTGLLDGAYLTMYRCFFDEDGINVGSYVNFSGRVSDMNMTRSQIDMVVKSDLELLNVKLPRNLYQASCLNTLYDTSCGLNRETYAATSTVVTATKTSINCNLAQAIAHFDLGYVLFTSGANNGLRRTIKSYVPGNLTLLNPLPTAPAAGDSFKAYAGCDKNYATCNSKFNNLNHFKGFPFIPVPETTR